MVFFKLKLREHENNRSFDSVAMILRIVNKTLNKSPFWKCLELSTYISTFSQFGKHTFVYRRRVSATVTALAYGSCTNVS